MMIHNKQNTKAWISFSPRVPLALMTLSLFLMCQTAFAKGDVKEIMAQQVETVLKNAAAEVEVGLQLLQEQLQHQSDSAIGYEKRYCKINNTTDCLPSDSGGPNDQDNSKEKNSIVIDFATGGWVVGYSGALAPASTNLAPAGDLVENFDLVDNGVNNTFAQNLCLEVNFKNTDEVEYALPFYANKTIVFCAITSEKQELVNINNIDNIPDESDSSHKIINEGVSGWRCYNPHNALGNGGQGFGYDHNNAGELVRVVTTLPVEAVIFNKCLTEATPNLPNV